MSELATRAGKTLMAYVIFRYMLEYGGAHNILMVVPSISLVKQGINDMNDYQEFFTSEAVWANGEYCAGSNLTIGTFQSLVRRCCKGKRGAINKHYDPSFFDKFDVVCIDECHKADCESIKQIMSQPFIRNAKLIFGFSGTLPDKGTIESYGCQSLLGPCIQKIETMELVEAGYLAKPVITQIRIKYPEDLTDEYIKYGEYLCSNFVVEDGKKVLLPKSERDMTMIHMKKPPEVIRQMRENVELGLLPKESYAANLIDMCKAQGANLLVLEQMIAEHSYKKLEVMRDITFEWSSSNGVVFAHNEAYIDHLHQFFIEQYPDRPVYKIKGATTQKKRDKIITAMNTTDTNAILVASYGVVGTGLTFKNIDYAVFAQSFKSKIINGQSLGRGLLLAEGKTTFHLYDIVDIFPTECLKKQGETKTKQYREKNFEYRIVHR
jgi:superfamily II DNA or RNA helicase